MSATDDASRFRDFLRSRRSCRRFRPEPVPGGIVRRLLETAAHAPSAHDRRPWRFVVLSSSAERSRLAESMEASFRADLTMDGIAPLEGEKRIATSHARLMSAPVLVILCADTDLADPYDDERRRRAARLMLEQSAAAAGAQLLLAAHAEGLGAVWICSPLFAAEAVRTALGLPSTWEPQAMFYIGACDSATAKPKALDVDAITLWS